MGEAGKQVPELVVSRCEVPWCQTEVNLVLWTLVSSKWYPSPVSSIQKQKNTGGENGTVVRWIPLFLNHEMECVLLITAFLWYALSYLTLLLVLFLSAVWGNEALNDWVMLSKTHLSIENASLLPTEVSLHQRPLWAFSEFCLLSNFRKSCLWAGAIFMTYQNKSQSHDLIIRRATPPISGWTSWELEALCLAGNPNKGR